MGEPVLSRASCPLIVLRLFLGYMSSAAPLWKPSISVRMRQYITGITGITGTTGTTGITGITGITGTTGITG